MRSSVWVALLAGVLLAGTGCNRGSGEGGASSAAAHEAFGRLTVDELDAKMADAKAGKLALFLYDNNHKERFEKSHIPGAKWIEYDKIQANDLPADKNATLVFYCANEH